MIQPYNGVAFLMSGRIEGQELVDVNGKSREAVRIVVRSAGFLAFIWNCTYWYDPNDGTFLRSQGVRSFFSLIPTIIELVEDRRPAR